MVTPTPTTVQVKFQLRIDTAATWASVNPVLLSGEMGLESDTNKFKIGNGSTAWNSLGYFPFVVSGGTVTGNLEIGTTGTLTFEGSTADGFETTLGVVNPTADRTINLPNVSGTIITTGDTGTVTSAMIADGTIVNADVSASAAIAHSKLATITAGYVLIGNASGVPTATQVTGDVTISDTGVTAISSGVIVDADVSATAEIAVSKLANGTANQVIVTDGTNVSWSDDLTLAGNLTVNGTTTTINTQDLLVEDKNIIIGNVTTPDDTTANAGGITLKGATDKTINWYDATDSWTSSENIDLANGKSYRINTTEVLSATTLGSGVTSSSLTSVGTLGSVTVTGDATAGTFIPTGGTAPTNGLYLPATNSVALSTNGVGKLFVDANGKVSIQSDAVNGPVLELNNTDTTVTVGDDYGSVQWYANDASTGGTGIAASIRAEATTNGVDSALVFSTRTGSAMINATERLRITSAGLVGIGTSTPDAKLEVVGTDLSAPYQTLVSADSPTAAIVNQAVNTYFRIAGGSYGNASSVNLDLASNQSKNKGIQGGWRFSSITGTPASSATGSNLQIKPITYTSSDTITEGGASLTITNTGNVGIGTQSPSSELHIQNSTGNCGLRVISGTSGESYINMGDTSDENIGSINYSQASNSLFFITNNAERARIDSSGRLLVGTSSASGDPLLRVQGRVGSSTTYGVFEVGRGSLPSAADDLISLVNFTDNSQNIGAQISVRSDGGGWTSGSNHRSRLEFSTTADGASSPTPRMTIDSNGFVGIGRDPTVQLDTYTNSGTVRAYVESASISNDQYAEFVARSGGRSAAITIHKHSGIANRVAYVFLSAEDGVGSYIWVDNSDQLRISNTRLNTGTTGGTVVGTQTSDERLKNILGPVEYGLETIKQIETVRYALKAEPETEKLGFIAQQVLPLIPQSVFDTGEHIEEEPEDAPTKLGMEYVALIPVLVNAIKELSAKNDALEARLSALETP